MIVYNKLSKFMIIMIFVAVVIIAAVILFHFSQNRKESKTKNTICMYMHSDSFCLAFVLFLDYVHLYISRCIFVMLMFSNIN